MKLHAKAALSWSGRRLLVEWVFVEGWTLGAAAEAASVSVCCGRKWLGGIARAIGGCGIARRRRAGWRTGRQPTVSR